MRGGHAALAVDTDATFTSAHGGGDACEVCLKGDDLEVVHQLHVVGEGDGNSGGLLDTGRDGAIVGFGDGDALFNLADRVEIFVYFALVGWTDVTHELLGAVASHVENAFAVLGAAGARGGVKAVIFSPEKALEYEARIGFRGKRRRRSAPADRVGVGATIAGVARSY